jgi:hypothetical protein
MLDERHKVGKEVWQLGRLQKEGTASSTGPGSIDYEFE